MVAVEQWRTLEPHRSAPALDSANGFEMYVAVGKLSGEFIDEPFW
jgi:hypothetical protein